MLLAASTAAFGSSRAEKARALGERLRMREDPGSTSAELDRARGDQHLVDPVVELADDPDPVGVEGERVERRPHRPLDRVLEGDERPLAGAALDRLDRGGIVATGSGS